MLVWELLQCCCFAILISIPPAICMATILSNWRFNPILSIFQRPCSGSVRHLEQDFSACTLIGNCVPQVYSSNPGRGGDEPSVSSEFHKDIYFLLYPTWKPTLIIIFEHYVQNQRIYKTPSSGKNAILLES